MADSPELTTGMRLLDDIKRRGFTFHRIAPGPDGPLEGIRETDGWRDTIHIGGFSSDCYAWRERRSSLILPGGGLVTIRVQGAALDVLTEVLDWPELPT
ncbi:MAG TPA: hypothetical protein VHH34_17460 [Pseudonocardiaceae bacterium]|nr:hypothetical protein [Pseudonocardiaceae bacterium]